MYYDEKWSRGVFYIKTTPNGQWKKKVPSVDQMQQAVTNGHISFVEALSLAINIHTNKY